MNALHIDFIDEQMLVTEEQQLFIEELLQFAAREEQLDEHVELSISFVSDDEIQKMNQEYRGIDAPTDVISFALEDEAEGEIAFERICGMPVLLGDLIISMDTMKKQAVEYGHSEARELGFLALHGFLHLLGYDHMNETDEKKMFGRQDELLAAFGLKR